jgi:uncharacterized protein DUF4351
MFLQFQFFDTRLPEADNRVLPLEKLEQFIEELLNFTSRDDLTAWLLEQAPDET